VEICANGASRNAINLAVEVRSGVEVGGDGIRWQASIIRIANRVVAPKRGRCIEVLVHAAQQVDISAVTCGAEPATRCRKRGDERPGIGRRAVLVSVSDSDVVGDAAETVNAATLRSYGISGDGDRIGRLLCPRADGSAWGRGRSGRDAGGVNPCVWIARTRTTRRLRICGGERRQKKPNKEGYQAN